MGESPPVLLLDDGELDDVQQILGETGVQYGRIRGGAIAPETPPPRTLLIATPRRIDAVAQLDFTDLEKGPVRIVVVDQDSPTLRSQLRMIGFDYLIRRPVHPEAIRLLILHCLYTGEERRSGSRIPAGIEISFRSGFRRHHATLTDLSLGGCRLLSRRSLKPDKRIQLTIPEMQGVEKPFVLRGRVARTTTDERLGKESLHRSAIVFEDLGDTRRQILSGIVEAQVLGSGIVSSASSALAGDAESSSRRSRATGAGQVPSRSEPSPVATASAPPGASQRGEDPTQSQPAPLESVPSGDAERRTSRRSAYVRKIPAYGERALRVLVGRDLSARGMRVEHVDLSIGDRLHLAIYGDAGNDPLLVWASVDRDDHEGGMVLIFDEPEPAIVRELEKLIARLPSVESLTGGEVAAMGTVVSEILDF